MTATHTDRLRSIMLVAWDFRRAEPARAFADCLRASWKLAKAAAKVAERMMRKAAGAGLVYLTPSVIRSPSTDASRGQRYGRWNDRQAGRMIFRIGA